MIALKPENVVDVLFGNRLRQLLDERNISQAHFADRIGVSRSRMNNYVAQRSEPDYATLIRIANTLDTSIDFLLGKSEHQGLPQTACLSGFPDFIPSRGAGGEPPDPSCWIPLYGCPRCRSIKRLDVAGLYDGKAIRPRTDRQGNPRRLQNRLTRWQLSRAHA